MALLDVSFLTYDPDFSDTLTLVRRTYSENRWGENVLTETQSQIIGVVQSNTSEADQRLNMTQQSAELTDGIIVHYNGVLIAEGTPDQYADVLIWQGRRYQVNRVEENFNNYGGGFTKAFCILEPASV